MKNVLSKFSHEYLVPIGAFTQLRLESQNDKKCDTFEKLSQIISAIIRLIYPLSCELTQPGIWAGKAAGIGVCTAPHWFVEFSVLGHFHFPV
jgi:hypothetical protein